MDYYRPLTSIRDEIASFTVLDLIASFMTVYLLLVTICTVTGCIFLKKCA